VIPPYKGLLWSGSSQRYQRSGDPTIFRYAKFMATSITRTRKKAGRGRPSTGSKSVHLRVLPDQMAEIDEWIVRQPDKPSLPEAIRRLVQLGLDTDAADKLRVRPAQRKEEP
jgi:hypothetical protein